MFQMHRIFCATPWELEAERNRFYDLVAAFNETNAMRGGVLYVPVTVTNIRDKRPLQYAIDENIRDCRHYIILLLNDWGPPERNFEIDYHLAVQCVEDSTMPMRSVALLSKRQPSGRKAAPELPAADASFATLEEFDECILGLLSTWMESLISTKAAASG